MAHSRDEDTAPGEFDDGNYAEVYSDPRTPQAEYDSDPEQTPVPSRKPSLSARSIKSVKSSKPPSSVRSYRHEDVNMEEEDEVEQHMSVKQSRAKGKQRQVDPDPEPDPEPEEELPIAEYEEESPEPEYEEEAPVAEYEEEPQPYGDNAEGDIEPEEEPAPPSPRKHTGKRRKGDDDSLEKAQPKKKARSENDGVEPKKKAKGRPRKQDVLTEGMHRTAGPQRMIYSLVIFAVIQDQNIDENGLRRGARMRYKPLDWWRCEKVVYGRRETGKSLVPTIKEIRRIPQEETKPLGGRYRRKRPPRSKSVTVEYDEDLVDPEEGWDDETEPTAYVLDYPGGEEVQRRTWAPLIFVFRHVQYAHRCGFHGEDGGCQGCC